jgi:hypothetical protein
MSWFGFNWLRMGSVGGPSWSWWWTFLLQKWRKISCPSKAYHLSKLALFHGLRVVKPS